MTQPPFDADNTQGLLNNQTVKDGVIAYKFVGPLDPQ